MRELKKITSLILAGSMALFFCSCQTLDHLGLKGSNLTRYPRKVAAKVDNNFIKWCDCSRFYLYGHEIVFGQTTVQELYDTGAYCVFYDYADDECLNKTYFTLEDEVSTVYCRIYPDEASAELEFAKIGIGIRSPVNIRGKYKVKDWIISSVGFYTVNASVWGDNFALDFPLTITPAELLENSGEPYRMETFTSCLQIEYYGGIRGQIFEFDKRDKLTFVDLNERRE